MVDGYEGYDAACRENVILRQLWRLAIVATSDRFVVHCGIWRQEQQLPFRGGPRAVN